MAGPEGLEAQAVPIEGAGALAATAGVQLGALAARAGLQRRATAATAGVQLLALAAAGPEEPEPLQAALVARGRLGPQVSAALAVAAHEVAAAAPVVVPGENRPEDPWPHLCQPGSERESR